ncbi:MAG: VWA domain-containing protein [Flavobacteriales bacterium]|nr:VWA domain-containing protein [Flavobacteriales bacterium]MCB9167990.1 VWA domain-containing protein [Flavobacteriales bacterium]
MVYIGRRFEWARPEWRWSLLLLPVLLAGHLWWRNARRPTVRISTWQAFLHAPQGMLTRLRHVPFALSMAGLGMMLLAMARPQSRDAWQDVETEGIDIVIAMDISASMLAKDFKPDRLSASKAVAMKFIDERPNDRIGLVVYEGEAFTQCPLTTDHDVLKDLFAKTRSGLIQGGTAVGMGLATAVNRLRESTAKSKVVILLTDGVNNAGTVQPLDAAQIAKQMGVRVYTIGVGTRGKAMSPVAIYPNGQYKFDMVDVEIDEDMLRQVADITGGKYFRATNEHKLTDIYDEIDKLEKTRIKVTEHSRRNEEYFPFLLAGGCLLLLAFSVDNGLLRLTP